MSDKSAPAETAATTHAAAPEAAATPAPAKNESFRDAMDRLGAEPELAKPTGDDAPPPKAAEKKPEAAPDPKAQEAQEREAFKAMAQKLGYQLEDAAVTNKERAEWRRMRKEHTDAIKNAETSAKSSIEELQKAAEAEINFGKALREARKSNDYNQIAKLLEYEDWNALQEGVAKAVTDPAYQEVLELKKWKADQEKAAAEQQEKLRVQQEQQAKAAERQKYLDNLSSGMKASTDPLVKAFADDPMFVNVVFNVQDANWDGGDQVLAPERAIHVKAPGAKLTLHDELKNLYERLAPVFGAKTEPEEPKKAKAARAPQLPGKPAPSGPKNDESRAAFMSRMQAAIDEAAAEERIAARKGRAGLA